MEAKKNIKFPKLAIQDDMVHIANNIFIPKLSEGIHKQTSINGGPFPKLEPSTIKRKSGNISKRIFTKKGDLRGSSSRIIEKVGLTAFVNKTLIETGKLVSSFRFKKSGKYAVIVYINKDRHDIGKYLQIDGVGKKRKKFEFFGISRQMEKLAINHMRNEINKRLKSGK